MKLTLHLLIVWILTTTGQSLEILLRSGNPAIQSIVHQRVPGYAGVLPYIRDVKRTTYVLLSREAEGKNEGKYCGLGGTNEFNAKKNRYHRFIFTALKELREESVDLIKLTETYLLKNSHFHFDCRNPDFHKLTALTELSPAKYRSSAALYFARRKLHAKYQDLLYYGCLPEGYWPYLEKDDFRWITVQSLLPAIVNHQMENIRVISLDGNVQNPFEVDTSNLTREMTISLRPAFLETLIGLHGVLAEME